MIYLQIALLILISVTQLFRAGMIGDWQRFRRSKVMLLVSFSVALSFILGPKIFGPSLAEYLVLQEQLVQAFAILSAGFYLFSLKKPSGEDSHS